MANRFKQKENTYQEIKQFVDERSLTSVNKSNFSKLKSKNKYKILLRLNDELEKPLKTLAEENGLSVTKTIELLIRKAIKKGEI